jgi:hypothetical protein
MFAAARTRSLPIRLLGVQLSNLGVLEQRPLFDRNERVGAAIDRLRARFGFGTVSLATTRRRR